jgi:hypothetical protein
MPVRPLAISCASREFMGGGAAPWYASKSHSTPGVSPGHGKKTLFYQWIRESRWGWWDMGGPWRGGPVTEIIDRRQPAVMRAGAAGRASPGESAPSRGGGRGSRAVRKRHAARG